MLQKIAIAKSETDFDFNQTEIRRAPMGCLNNAGIDGHALAIVLANADIVIELSDGVCALRVSREIATKLTFSGAWDKGVKALCDLIILWDDNRAAVINVLVAQNNSIINSNKISNARH